MFTKIQRFASLYGLFALSISFAGLNFLTLLYSPIAFYGGTTSNEVVWPHMKYFILGILISWLCLEGLLLTFAGIGGIVASFLILILMGWMGLQAFTAVLTGFYTDNVFMAVSDFATWGQFLPALLCVFAVVGMGTFFGRKIFSFSPKLIWLGLALVLAGTYGGGGYYFRERSTGGCQRDPGFCFV